MSENITTIFYAILSSNTEHVLHHKLHLQPMYTRYDDWRKMHYLNANVYPWPNDWVMFTATASENAGDEKSEAYCGMFIAMYVVFGFASECTWANTPMLPPIWGVPAWGRRWGWVKLVMDVSQTCWQEVLWHTKQMKLPFFLPDICQDAPLFAKHDRLVSSAKFFSQNILPSTQGCSRDKCGKRGERGQNLR